MGSWPSAAPPPLPSAITTTQCQHPPKGRHLHQHCRDRRSSNSGNHSNSQSLPQREHPATTSRDFPGAGGRVSGRVGARARGLAGGSAHVGRGAGRSPRAQGPFSPRSRIKQRPACWAARAPGPRLRGGMSSSPGPRREPPGWAPLGGLGMGPAVRRRTERYRYLL